jgi:hypothetical protein
MREGYNGRDRSNLLNEGMEMGKVSPLSFMVLLSGKENGS